jgi:hypothetical protein
MMETVLPILFMIMYLPSSKQDQGFSSIYGKIKAVMKPLDSHYADRSSFNHSSRKKYDYA